MEEMRLTSLDLITSNITCGNSFRVPRGRAKEHGPSNMFHQPSILGGSFPSKWQVKEITSILTDTVPDALTKAKKTQQITWPVSTPEGYRIRVKRVLISVFDYPEDERKWDNALLEYNEHIYAWYDAMVHPCFSYGKTPNATDDSSAKRNKPLIPMYPKSITYAELYYAIHKKFAT
jgi:hypothetical protein